MNLLKNLIILALAVVLGYLGFATLKNQEHSALKNKSDNVSDLAQLSKAEQVQKFIAKYKKPQKIEIESFTKKYAQDIESIKALKVKLEESSTFYMQIQLFSDDTDENAPLVLQVRFKDIKNQAMISEESINLK